MTISRISGLMLACLALLCITVLSASAERIYTTAESDGSVGYLEGGSGEDAYHFELHDSRSPMADAVSGRGRIRPGDTSLQNSWFSIIVLQFPISALSGTTLAPNSAKLHVFGDGVGGVNGETVESLTSTLYGADFDRTGALNDGAEGWVGNDYFHWEVRGTLRYEDIRDCCDDARNRVADTPTILSGEPRVMVIDVTADLQRQIDAGYDWAGYFFSMNHFSDPAPYGYSFTMATYEDQVNRPYLEIVPEPSGLMALMAGITGLVASRKAKVKSRK